MRRVMRQPRVAIVHDWLVTYGGAERVLEQIIELYPEADLFSLCDFVPDSGRGFLHHKQVSTSFIQKLPGAKKHYRSFLPLMPFAIEQFDLSDYDIVISSSHAVAKGVITGPDQIHLCLCYSPVRYAWDLTHEYLRDSGLNTGLKGLFARYALHRLRMWDYRTANGVDRFIAISEFIARRIRKVYGRSSTVVYPPVDCDAFELSEEKEDFYLTASRMVPYKKMDLIVEAFASMPGRQLVVVGDGPDFKKIQAQAGSNVRILGYQPFEVLHGYMKRARAFIFAAEEDFGIVPVEAQACGTPVIAYGKGGVTETVVEGRSGLFFDAQTVESLTDAVRRFDKEYGSFNAQVIRENALRFSVSSFKNGFSSVLDSMIEESRGARPLNNEPRISIREILGNRKDGRSVIESV